MTPNELRQAMARAFAEEVGKYVRRRDKRRWCVFSLPDDVCRFVSNIDGVSEDCDLEDCQQFINERGIAAAMRVAAEHCKDVEVPTKNNGNVVPLSIVNMERGLNLIGEMT